VRAQRFRRKICDPTCEVDVPPYAHRSRFDDKIRVSTGDADDGDLAPEHIAGDR
jgi:hypothetical protein